MRISPLLGSSHPDRKLRKGAFEGLEAQFYVRFLVEKQVCRQNLAKPSTILILFLAGPQQLAPLSKVRLFWQQLGVLPSLRAQFSQSWEQWALDFMVHSKGLSWLVAQGHSFQTFALKWGVQAEFLRGHDVSSNLQDRPI